jgi:NADH-quinone oxidoreductase subunit F
MDSKLFGLLNQYEKKGESLIPLFWQMKTEGIPIDVKNRKMIAQHLNLPLSQVASAAGFYAAFCDSLKGEEMELQPDDFAECGETGGVLKKAGTTMEEYRKKNGYSVLAKVLKDSSNVCTQLEDAGLAGRGGAAFSVGRKWAMVQNTVSDEKYVVCNGSEGEPGTYKDMMILTKSPHCVLEGMLICGATVGASRGVIYLRGEYERAYEAVQKAIQEAYDAGYLGNNILGSEFCFDLTLCKAGGAYICGEETALLEALEGRRGEPRIKPPFPGVSGLQGKPTVINNAESFAYVPDALTAKTGEKVYTVTGCVEREGVYEAPLGITVRELLELAGGCLSGKQVKAIQIGGGATGTIVGAEYMDLMLSPESCSKAGIPMGTGSLIFYDQDTDLIAVAKKCMEFLMEQSCGRCTPCRYGTREMVRKLQALLDGEDVLEEIQQLADYMKQNSFCAFGQMAPTAVLSALKVMKVEETD